MKKVKAALTTPTFSYDWLVFYLGSLFDEMTKNNTYFDDLTVYSPYCKWVLYLFDMRKIEEESGLGHSKT